MFCLVFQVMGPRNRGAVERRWAARRTPVSDIFRGKTRVRLHRATHHDVTDAVQPFFTLQLDIEVTNKLLMNVNNSSIFLARAYHMPSCRNLYVQQEVIWPTNSLYG